MGSIRKRPAATESPLPAAHRPVTPVSSRRRTSALSLPPSELGSMVIETRACFRVPSLVIHCPRRTKHNHALCNPSGSSFLIRGESACDRPRLRYGGNPWYAWRGSASSSAGPIAIASPVRYASTHSFRQGHAHDTVGGVARGFLLG